MIISDLSHISRGADQLTIVNFFNNYAKQLDCQLELPDYNEIWGYALFMVNNRNLCPKFSFSNVAKIHK